MLKNANFGRVCPVIWKFRLSYMRNSLQTEVKLGSEYIIRREVSFGTKGTQFVVQKRLYFFVTKEITLVLPDTWVTGKQCFVWFFREVKLSNSRL